MVLNSSQRALAECSSGLGSKTRHAALWASRDRRVRGPAAPLHAAGAFVGVPAAGAGATAAGAAGASPHSAPCAGAFGTG